MYSIVEGRVWSCQCSRWYHRVATDLRNMKGEEFVMEPCLWTFRDVNGVIHGLCLVYVDDFMLACSDSPFGKHVFESINNLYEWRKWESRVFKQCGAQITQAYNRHTGTWGGFEIRSFRNVFSCTFVLDFGSLHQKPLIPNIVTICCQFRAS